MWVPLQRAQASSWPVRRRFGPVQPVQPVEHGRSRARWGGTWPARRVLPSAQVPAPWGPLCCPGSRKTARCGGGISWQPRQMRLAWLAWAAAASACSTAGVTASSSSQRTGQCHHTPASRKQTTPTTPELRFGDLTRTTPPASPTSRLFHPPTPAINRQPPTRAGPPFHGVGLSKTLRPLHHSLLNRSARVFPCSANRAPCTLHPARPATFL